MQFRLEGVLWIPVFICITLAKSAGSWPIPQSRLSLQLGIKHLTHDSSWDMPEQRGALISLYTATNGSSWIVPASDSAVDWTNASWGWDKRNTSYCSWPGILCCNTAQQLQQLLADLHPYADNPVISCGNGTDVLGLFLLEAGLQGTLPEDILHLPALRALMIGNNPGLGGSWPAPSQLLQLRILDVHDTSLSVCLNKNNGSHTGTGSSCELPSWLAYGSIPADQTPDAYGLLCPQLTLNSSSVQQQLGSSVFMAFLGLLHINGFQPMNTVRYSAGFTRAHGCACAAAGEVIWVPASSSITNNSAINAWRCEASSAGTLNYTQLAFLIAFVAATAVLLVGGCWFLYRTGGVGRAWAYLTGKLDMYTAEQQAAAAAADGGEMTLGAKRSRFPGTPSIALAKGRGVIAVSEVLVTWVVTDVEGSTQLWEWDPVVMGAAVDQHNIVLRSLLDQHGGHEVRTDGDSFTLAFHDAADAVAYCIQAQEELLEVPWPKKLLEHPFCATVRLGEVCAAKHPEAAAEVVRKGGIPLEKQGPLVMNGLRVRMGINTGVPDDIFVHDLTQHVEYRGDEYNLTDDLAGIAAGGQILMGPKTFQRWNRVFSQAAIPTNTDVPVHNASSAIGLHGEVGNLSGPHQWHNPRQKSGNLLRRTLESVAGFLGGPSARPLTSNMPIQDPRNAPGDGDNGGFHDSMVNEQLISGGDTLLVLNSQGGSQTVAIGRTTDEAAAAADAGTGMEVGLYEEQPWPDGTFSANQHTAEVAGDAAMVTRVEQPVSDGVHAAHAHKGSKRFPSQHQPHPPAQAPAIEGNSAVRKSPVLVRSKTVGGINFAINLAGSATASAHTPAANGVHVVAAAGAGAQSMKRNSGLMAMELATMQAETRKGLIPAGTVSIKGPSYGPQVAKHVSFMSSKPSAVGAARRATTDRLQLVQVRVEPGSVSPPGPVAEGVEQHSTLVIRSSPSAVHTASPVETSAVVKVLRYISASVGSFIKSGAPEIEYEGASYLVSTNGSSNSTQHTRMGSKSARSRSRSSIWGSIHWKSATNLGGDDVDDRRSFESSNAVLLDLGYYQWRPDEPTQHPGLDGAAEDNAGLQAAAAAAAAAAEAAQGGLLHLVQVQSHRLAPRMLLFDWPLTACEGGDAILQQLLPGFFDAPGASSLMFTSMRSLMEIAGASPPAKPEVAIAFVAPAGLKEVQALGPEVYQSCHSLFTSLVREVLLAVGGYESKEVEGQVLAAFETPAQAVEWALALQCALLQAPWPLELAQLPCTTTIDAPKPDTSGQSDCGTEAKAPGDTQNLDNNLFYNPGKLFRGIRARVGIWSGPMDRVLPHGKSGRADYLGPPANRAARMMGAAQGGQVLVEEGIMQQVLQEWQTLQGEKANAALAAAAAPSTADSSTPAPASMPTSSTPGTATAVSLEWDLQPGSPNSAYTPKLSEGPPSPTVAHKLLHSSTFLSSRRSRRRTRQEGAEGPAGFAVGHHLNASLLTSFKRNAPRPLLFESVLDSAALLGPATTTLQTARGQKPPAPWDAFPDDPAETATAAVCTAPQRIPPSALQDGQVEFAAGSAGDSPNDPTQLPNMLRLQLPASLGPTGAPQVLTIAPAAYQPRGGGPVRSDPKASNSNRTTRSTSSSTGSAIVSPPTQVMKGRKSLSVAIGTRSSMDVPDVGANSGVAPVLGRLRLPAAPRQSIDNPEAVTAAPGALGGPKDTAGRRTSLSMQSAGVRRRSMQFGSQLVDPEDLYAAVEAALEGPNGPHTAHARRKRRPSLLQHKQVPRLQDEQLPSAGQAVQSSVVAALSSAFYSAAVVGLKKPPTAASAALTRQFSGNSSDTSNSKTAQSAGGSATDDAEHMYPPAATSGQLGSSGSGDMYLAQLLPTSAFAIIQARAELGSVTEDSACSSPQYSGAATGHGDGCLSPAPSSARPVSSAASSDSERRSTNDLLKTIEEQVRHMTAGNNSTNGCNNVGTAGEACTLAGRVHAKQQTVLPADSCSAGSNAALKCTSGKVRRTPQLKLVLDDPASTNNQPAGPGTRQGEGSTGASRATGREKAWQSVPSEAEGRLGRSMLHNVSFPSGSCGSKQSLSLQGLQASIAANAQLAERKQQSTSGSGSQKSSGSGSQCNSSSGRRHKAPHDSSVMQIADALYSVLRSTGGSPGSVTSHASTSSRSDARIPAAVKSAASRDGAEQTSIATQGSSRKPTNSNEGSKPAKFPSNNGAEEGQAAGIAGVWEMFTNAIKSASGSRATSGSGVSAAPAPAVASGNRGHVLEKYPSVDAAHNKQQSSSSTPGDPQKPGIIAECFKITPAAAPGDTGYSLESITMIKYTALRQQAALETAQESLTLAPRLAAAAAAAGAYSSGNSTAGTTASLGSSVKLPRWPQICVDVSVHRVGGFRLKGVDKVVDVVQVMPATLVGRLEYLLPPSTKGKSQCVAPATDLVVKSKAFLPDLSQLIEWMAAPLLAQQQQAWQEEQEQQLPQQQEQPDWLQGEQSGFARHQEHQVLPDMHLPLLGENNQAKVVFHNDTGTAGLGHLGIHNDGCDATDGSPRFSIKAYHGPVGRSLTYSQDGSTPLAPVTSSGSGASVVLADQEAMHSSSMPGSACQEHLQACGVSGCGAVPHLPNYVPSQPGSMTPVITSPAAGVTATADSATAGPGSMTPVTTTTAPGVTATAASRMMRYAGGVLSQLKGPALLQTSTPLCTD